MRILTFNHHETYLCSLADIGAQFDVVTKYGDLDLSWNTRSRAVPSNMRLVHFDDQIRQNLRNGIYDVVICHTVKNLLWVFPYRKPRYVFVAHIPLFRSSLIERLKAFAKRSLYQIFATLHQTRFHAVSEFKRASWNIAGDVTVLSPKELPALIPNEGYERCVVVCNDLATRREELGLDMLIRLRKRFSITILGNNPGIEGATKPIDFKDFTEILRRHRIYLYTIRYPLGDGYNTAMLEAMRLGMAIVTVPNPSSPIVHNENGLIGETEEDLARRLQTLLRDRALVDRLGLAAQQTIAERFNQDLFIKGWKSCLAAVLALPANAPTEDAYGSKREERT